LIFTVGDWSISHLLVSGSAGEEVGFSGINNGKVRRRNTGVAGGAEKKVA
jgi:hypothetical protein